MHLGDFMQNNGLNIADSATLSNLDHLSLEASKIDEGRVLEIDDVALSAAKLAIALLEGGLDTYSVLSLISDRLSFGEHPIHDERDREFDHYLRIYRSSGESIDSAVFTDIFVSRMREGKRPLTELELLSGDDTRGSIAYVRNQLSDEAYDVFSQDIRHSTVCYKNGFKECADALASGEVGYALFPIIERGGARILAVSDIIYRNDFKINAITPVFGSLGDADVKYALVSKNFTHHAVKQGDDRYLELRVGNPSGSLHALLSAASFFGIGVHRVDTVALYEGDSDGSVVSLVLRSGDDFGPMLTYLLLFMPDVVPVGIYKNLE